MRKHAKMFKYSVFSEIMFHVLLKWYFVRVLLRTF